MLTVAVRLVRDPKTQRPKGFGFVKFASEVDARNAVKAMNGRVMNSSIFYLSWTFMFHVY